MSSQPDEEAPCVPRNHVAQLDSDPEDNLVGKAEEHCAEEQEVDPIATTPREQRADSSSQPILSDQSSVVSSVIDTISSALRLLNDTNHGSVVKCLEEALSLLSLLREEHGSSNDVQQEDIKQKELDTQDEEGWTSLHRACEKGDLETVKMLVAAGADVDLYTRRRSANASSYTAVELASMKGHVDILRHLITAGAADVNTQAPLNWTPLHHACSNGNLEVVQILLAAGANTRALTMENWTGLHFACRYGYMSIVKALLDVEVGRVCSSTSPRDNDEITDSALLILANTSLTENGPPAVTQPSTQARQHTSLVDMQEDQGWTALDFAMYYNHYDVVRHLLSEGGIDVKSAANSDHETLLHKAARNGQAAITESILAAHAQVEDNESKLVGFVNALTTYERTALLDACCNGHVDVVRILLCAGADTTLGYHTGWTPAMEAASAGHADVLETLFTPLPGSSVATNIDFPGPDDWTALHFAATKGQDAAVKVLLDHGANVNAKTNFDYTPLYLVCRRGHADLVQTLLDAGADLATSVDKRGISPLGIAAERGHAAAVRALLNFVTDDDKAAAKKLAEENDWSLVVELLKPSSTEEPASAACDSNAADAAVDAKSSTCGDEQETDYNACASSEEADVASEIEWGWVHVTGILDNVERLEVRGESQTNGSHC